MHANADEALQAVRENQVTADIGGKLGTREAGDYIAAAVRLDGPQRPKKNHSLFVIFVAFVIFVPGA